jgi:hypothetical protein
LGDFAVGLAVGGHLGDASFAGGKGVDAGADEAARSGAGREQFGVRSLGDGLGAASIGELEAVVEQGAGRCALVGSAECGTELGEGLGPFEQRR